MNKLFLWMAFLIFLAAGDFAQQGVPLFVIERNTNSNRVYYEARIGTDSLLDLKQPLRAYWIMWEKDPSGKTREELTLLEKEKAYGFKVKQGQSRTCSWFSIAPLPDRPIKVSVHNGNATAEAVIDGKYSVLKRVSVNAGQRHFLPHVNYVELFGTDSKSGEDTYEKIANK